MPGRIYPDEKKKLLEILSQDELEIIKKDYPFKRVRNAKIHELGRKGVSYTILAELTGLTRSSTHRIGHIGRNTMIRKEKKD